MEDDIDIEEHGLMFPDLSIVKTEAFDYDEEIPDYDMRVASPQPSTSASEAIPDSTTDLMAKSPPRVADSPHMVTSTQEDSLSLAPSASLSLAQSNCIILGSKPTTQPEDSVHVGDDIDYEHCCSAAVELQDWGPFLETSKSYCSECEILFPTSNALDVHKMTAHSFLVAIERKEEESTEIEKSDGIIEKECFVCKEFFENEGELIQHIYLHVNNTLQCDKCPETFFSQELLEQHTLLHKSEGFDMSSFKKGLYYTCHICACQFFNATIYKRHMLTYHNTEPINYDTFALELTCQHCGRTCANLNSIHKHIKHQHTDIVNIKLNPASKPKFVVKHKSKTIISKPLSQQNNTIKSNNKIFVPKSTLFKCAKCDVHFLNGSIAVLHYNNCTGSVANSYKCSQCELQLKLSCQTAHEKQHIFGDDFNAFVIGDEDLRPRILARCPKCSIHFSEQRFWFHIERCDSEKANHFDCSKCKRRLDEQLRDKHEFSHSTLDYEANDFIVINYGDVSSNPDPDENQISNSGLNKKKMSKPSSDQNKLYKFYFCHICKCFANKLNPHFHSKMICKKVKKNACTICGLVFSYKTLTTHYRHHKQLKNFNLNNFQYYNMKNQKISQPIPEYHKCNRCKVSFHSKLNLKFHKCDAEHETCQVCNLKYSKVAFKLHMLFHHTTVSITKKTSQVSVKYEDPVKMYYCNSCEIYLHEKNHKYKCNLKKTKYLCRICGLVCSSRTHRELHKKRNFTLHDIMFFKIPDLQMIKPPVPKYQPCKKCRVHFCSKKDMICHKCGKENFSQCKICKIKLSSAAYKLHMPFHSYAKKQQIRKDNKTSTVADSNAKKQQIRKDNKISTVADSNAKKQQIRKDKTSTPAKNVGSQKKVKSVFYQCDQCKFCIKSRKDFGKHRCATTRPKKRYTCSKCGLYLSTLIYREHEAAHNNDPTLDREKFTIIPFSRKWKPLVQKLEATINIEVDAADNVMGEDTDEDLNSDASQTATTADDATKTTGKSKFYYTLFQCESCKLCMQYRRHSQSHRCYASVRKICQCANCGLSFNNAGFYNHKIRHENDPTYVRKNMSIIHFSPTAKNKTEFSEKNEEVPSNPTVIVESRADSDVDMSEINDEKDLTNNKSIAVASDGVEDAITDAALEDNRTTFFQCSSCKLCISYKNDSKSHRCNIATPYKRYTCTECGLYLSVRSAAKHKHAHENVPNFVRENFNIISFSPRQYEHLDTPKVNEGENSMINVSQIDKKYDHDETSAPELNQTTTTVDDTAKTTEKSELYYTLFQCESCKLCMQHRRHSQSHRCYASVGYKRCQCAYCGLSFNIAGFNNHKLRHEYDPTYVRKNISIINFYPIPKIKTELSEEVEEVAASNPTIIANSYEDTDADISETNDQKHFENNESIAEATNEVEKTGTDAALKDNRLPFFQCNSCKLCILNKSDTKSHRCHIARPNQRYTCTECGLYLSNRQSKKHKRAHDNIPTFVRENFNIIPFKPRQDKLVNTSKVHDDTSASELQDSEATTNETPTTFTHENVNTTSFPLRQEKIVDTSTTNDKYFAIDDSQIDKKYDHDDTCSPELDDSEATTNETSTTFTHENVNTTSSPSRQEKIVDTSTTNDKYFAMDDSQIDKKYDYDDTCAPELDDSEATTNDTQEITKKVRFTFYQCQLCKVCLKKQNDAQYHEENQSCFAVQSKRYTCDKCGLFLNTRSFHSHRMEHMDPLFVRENFKIIPFSSATQMTEAEQEPTQSTEAAKDESTTMDEIGSEFIKNEGNDKRTSHKSKNEFIFYQCSSCKLCIKKKANSNKHRCDIADKAKRRYTCRECGLYLGKRAKHIHQRSHETNPEFIPKNFKIITFESLDSKLQLKEYVFYQCSLCNLCVNANTVNSHCCFTTKKRFTCRKCGLCLSKSIVKQHKRSHKYDSFFVRENFKVIPFSPKNDYTDSQKQEIETIIVKNYLSYAKKVRQTDGLVEDSQTTNSADNEGIDASDMDISDDMTSDTDSSDKDENESTYTFYQCTECSLCLHYTHGIKEHRCITHQSVRFYCGQCGLYLSKRMFRPHHQAHRQDPIFTRDNFKIIPFTPTQGIVFYQCSLCNLSLPKKAYADSHNCLSPRFQTKAYTCDRCGLKLSSSGFFKHQAAHNEDPTYERANFKIISFSVKTKSLTDSRTNLVENSSQLTDKQEYFNNTENVDGCKGPTQLDKEQAANADHERTTIDHVESIMVDKEEGSIREPDKKVIDIEMQNTEHEAKPKGLKIKKYTFYKCRKCDGCMLEERVPEHYINKWCRNIPESRKCKKCENKFIDSEAHARLHKRVKLYPSKLNIVYINDIENFFEKINKKCVFYCQDCKTVMFSRIKMENHTFSCTKTETCDVICCNKCQLSIRNDENILQAHALQHHDMVDFMHEKIRVIYFNASGMVNVTENPQKHTLYQCVKCATCVMSEVSVVSHIKNEHCTTSTPLLCKKCGYLINRHSFGKHLEKHLMFRNMTRCNIDIIPFGKKGIEVNTDKKMETSAGATKDVAADGTEQMEIDHSDDDQNATSETDVTNELAEDETDQMEQDTNYGNDETDPANKLAADKRDQMETDKNDSDDKVMNETDAHDRTLYFCRQCDVYLMTPKTAYEHESTIHHRPEHIYLCPECRINFTKNGLSYHKRIHHKSRGYKLADFIIKDIQKMNEKDIEKKQSVGIKRKHDGEIVNVVVDIVYQCTCKLYFLCETSFNDHLEQCDGVETTSGLQCSKCNLVFDEKQLLRHSLKHHSSDAVFKYNLKPPEELQSMLYKCGRCYVHFLKKTDMLAHIPDCPQHENNGIKCSECRLLIHETVYELHKTQHQAKIINPYSYTIITYISEDETYTLYKCNICDSHFLRNDGIVWHLKRYDFEMHSTPIRSIACELCKIVTNPKRMIEHNEWHHTKDVELDAGSTKPTTRLETEQNENRSASKGNDSDSNIYYCGACRVHFENEKSFQSHSKPITKYQACEVCALVFPNDSISSHVERHHVELNLKLEDLKIIKSTCVEDIGKLITKESNQKKIERRVYFKCKNCNVTFLNKKNCMKHMKKHVPVPDYDFIACKICNRNFLVDSLKYHMSHHKSMQLNDTTLLTITYSTEYDLDESNIARKTTKFLLGQTLDDADGLTDSDETGQESAEDASDDETNSDNVHPCSMCNKKYKTERAKDLHISLDHLDEKRSCPMCKRTYHLSILNDLHLCIKNDFFKCCICENIYQTHLLESHSREHLDYQPSE